MNKVAVVYDLPPAHIQPRPTYAAGLQVQLAVVAKAEINKHSRQI